MFIRTGLAVLGLSLVAAAPAHAALCTGGSGFVVNFGVQVGEPYTEEELNNLILMQLRQAGVDATRVEHWSGCIRAFVRKPEGGEEMQFFDPDTLERVD